MYMRNKFECNMYSRRTCKVQACRRCAFHPFHRSLCHCHDCYNKHQPTTVRCYSGRDFYHSSQLFENSAKHSRIVTTLVASMLTRHLVFVCWVWLCRTSCAQQVRKTIFGFLNLFLPTFDCFLSLGAELRKRRPVLRKPVPNHLIA